MSGRRLPALGAVSDAEARRLLDTYLPVVYAVAPLYAHLSADEARAAGEDAILEAYLSHNPGRALEATWVRRVVHWRLAEADRALVAESLDVDPQIVNGVNPEFALLQATAVRLVARLSRRHQNIVDGRMRGETFAEIAAQIGISTQRAHAEAKKAFRLLRSMMEDEP